MCCSVAHEHSAKYSVIKEIALRMLQKKGDRWQRKHWDKQLNLGRRIAVSAGQFLKQPTFNIEYVAERTGKDVQLWWRPAYSCGTGHEWNWNTQIIQYLSWKRIALRYRVIIILHKLIMRLKCFRHPAQERSDSHVWRAFTEHHKTPEIIIWEDKQRRSPSS